MRICYILPSAYAYPSTEKVELRFLHIPDDYDRTIIKNYTFHASLIPENSLNCFHP